VIRMHCTLLFLLRQDHILYLYMLQTNPTSMTDSITSPGYSAFLIVGFGFNLLLHSASFSPSEELVASLFLHIVIDSCSRADIQSGYRVMNRIIARRALSRSYARTSRAVNSFSYWSTHRTARALCSMKQHHVMLLFASMIFPQNKLGTDTIRHLTLFILTFTHMLPHAFHVGTMWSDWTFPILVRALCSMTQ